ETLHVWPHSTRTADYQVLVDVGHGILESVPPSPVRTVRGRVIGAPGSLVAGSVLPTGLAATIVYDDGTRWWIEPLAGRVRGAAPGAHVVYRNEDLVPPEGECGNTNLADLTARRGDEVVGQPEDGNTGPIHCAELACDADFEYFIDHGSSVAQTEARINLVTTTMNPQYETETGITHAITTIVVRSSPADPYTSLQSGVLLCEFITEWTDNQQAIDFDIAKLFTGKEINGGTVGQASTLGDVCDRQGCCGCGSGGLDDGAFCYSQNDSTGGLGCSTDLMAHELGHLWDAEHCDPCPSTMRSVIGCFNSFSAASITDIVAHRDSRFCLDVGSPCGSPPRPVGACCVGANCAADTPQSECEAAGGVFQGDGTVCAPDTCTPALGGCCIECTCFSTSPTNCAALGGTYAGDGVSCTAEFCAPCGACCFSDDTCLNVDTESDCTSAGGSWQGASVSCGTITCPPFGACCLCDGSCTEVTSPDCIASGGTYLGPETTCGGAECSECTGACCFGDGTCTEVTPNACFLAGGAYQGNEVTCAAAGCPQPCPEDLNGNDAVDFADILAIIAAFGPCPPECPEDLDGSGDVGFGDILQVIAAWGPCP
ncbi:MAG: M12 family metallo-peptidase, partial [Planctomycetota bacterium]